MSSAATGGLRYFAYGSNLGLRRLRTRVPSAEVLGTALLGGHQLHFHKVGRDGSGKCDAFHTGDDGDCVEGRVFRMDLSEVPHLDRAEGLGRGYDKRVVTLAMADGATLDAFTYVATRIDDRLVPFDWYKLHVVTGAVEAGLSAGYRSAIEAVPCRIDPEAERRARELAIYTVDVPVRG